MKIKKCKIVSVIILAVILISLIPVNVYAADANISVGKKEIKVGETTNISASISSTEAWTLRLSSNGGNLSGTTESTDASDGETSKTVINANFSASNSGTYTITLSGEITGSDLIKKPISRTVQITVKEDTPTPTQPENNNNNNSQTPSPGTNTNNIPQDAPKQTETKSRNYYLSSLSVSTESGEIKLGQVGNESAGFNRGVENYVVIFPEDFDYENFEKISISATAEDSKSKISGTGEATINEGDNNFEIRCTAENGSAKTYKIKVTKPIIIKESELKLDSLIIEKINKDGESEEVKLDKEFDPENLSYECNIESEIDSLTVKLAVSKVKEQDIIVKINGTEIKRDLEGNLEEEQIELEDGTNTIRITLVSPVDENVSTDYVITAKKEVVVETVAKVSENKGFFTKENLPKIIIGVIIGVILILVITLIVLLIINKKQKKKAQKTDDGKLFNYDEEDTYLNDQSLDKLNKEYEEKADSSAYNEILDNNTEDKTKEDSEIKNDEVKNEETNNDTEEKYENLSNEDRKQKLDELVNELKSKNKGKKK